MRMGIMYRPVKNITFVVFETQPQNYAEQEKNLISSGENELHYVQE